MRIIVFFLLISICSIALGYYLLSVPPDAEFEDVVTRAWVGVTLTTIGGISIIVYIIRRR